MSPIILRIATFFKIFIYLAVSGLSCGMRDLSLWQAGSVVAAPGLSSCGAWALECIGLVALTCGILVLRPGIEPTSPALEGGFLTTGPPGKSQGCYI